MLGFYHLVGLLASSVCSFPTTISNTAQLERVPTWSVAFNQLERDPFPISVDILSNVEGSGAVCLDTPVVKWLTVSITAKNENVATPKKVKSCDAKQIWAFTEPCPLGGADTPPKEKGTAISNPSGLKRQGKDVPDGTKAIGLVCA